jgi:Planctomycete cytochrome C/WD domain, G-beta repeat
MCILCPLIGLALLLLFLLAQGEREAHAQAVAGGQRPISFINDVAPILKENCFACHDAKKRKGKLDMTTFENFRKGGSHDDPVEAGKPEDSTVVDFLTKPDTGRMPPKEAGPALPKAKIDVIRQWIKEGAKLDGGVDPKADLFRELRVRWQPPMPPVAYKVPVAVTALSFTPDSRSLVIGGYHELTVWDAFTGKLTKRIWTRAERAYALAYLPDGNLVVAGGRPGQEGDVCIYDLAAKTATSDSGVSQLDGVHDKQVRLSQLLDSEDAVLALALSQDGKKLAAGGCDRLARVWDVSGGAATARLERTIANHADWVCGLAYSHDGKYLLTASRDHSARTWDLAANAAAATFLGHQNIVYGVAYSQDGNIAMSVGEDGVLRYWHATDGAKSIGKQIMIGIGGHAKPVFRLAVASDPLNPLAATCGADGTVKLWNLAVGVATMTLTGLTDYAYALAISPDGTMVAAGSWNGEVIIWKVSNGHVVCTFIAAPGYVAARK